MKSIMRVSWEGVVADIDDSAKQKLIKNIIAEATVPVAERDELKIAKYRTIKSGRKIGGKGRGWTIEDVTKLDRIIRDGTSINQACGILGRTRDAITAQFYTKGHATGRLVEYKANRQAAKAHREVSVGAGLL